MRHLATLILILTSACAPEPAATTNATADAAVPSLAPAVATRVDVITHDSFSISEDALAAFQSANNIEVRFVQGGDTGELVNRLALSRGNPPADIVFGIDNTFLGRALEEDILEAYDSPALALVPDQFKLDPEHRALPIDYGDVCPNYDKAALASAGVEPPSSIADLTDPAYRDMLVVQNPATSSPALRSCLQRSVGLKTAISSIGAALWRMASKW
jgi:thiamine transport system substrate-binding protein